MRRLRSGRLYAALLGAGVLLLAGALVAMLLFPRRERRAVTTTRTVTVTTTVAPPPSTTTTPPTTTAPPPSPPHVAMTWDGAGAFVADTREVDPTWLGHELRDNGFTWLAVKLHDGTTATPIEPSWIVRFEQASGLTVGGWGVERTDPAAEAKLASDLVSQYGLGFYIADAEAEYKYTHADGTSSERIARSKQFVSAFRALQPLLPAGLSSYCRADTQDLDWQAWVDGGFAFLPQAYVNAQGDSSAPAKCVAGAAKWFPATQVHPTVGSYHAPVADPSPQAYAQLLADAGTTGFSVYLAETDMPDQAWKAYGTAIAAGTIAVAPQT